MIEKILDSRQHPSENVVIATSSKSSHIYLNPLLSLGEAFSMYQKYQIRKKSFSFFSSDEIFLVLEFFYKGALIKLTIYKPSEFIHHEKIEGEVLTYFK